MTHASVVGYAPFSLVIWTHVLMYLTIVRNVINIWGLSRDYDNYDIRYSLLLSLVQKYLWKLDWK